MKQSMTLYSVLLALLLSCTACGDNGSASNPPDGDAAKQPRFKTAPVAIEEIFDDITGIGTAHAELEVDVSPEISGRVTGVNCEIGDEVKAGAVLVELESEARSIMVEKKRAQLKKAYARLKKSDRDKVKADTLFTGGIMSDTDYGAAKLDLNVSSADLQLARAELRAAEKDLRDTKIAAPYGGSIALRSVEIGHFVTPGQKLLTLVDLEHITIVINVSELDIAKLAKTSTVQVTVDSLPGTPFTGTVKTIALKAEDSSRSFPVEIAVANSDRRILPGMVARVTIQAALPRKVMTIPHSAVSSMHGETIVRVLRDGEPHMRIVKLGNLRKDRVIVITGLAPEDKLVLPDPAAAL